MPDFNPKTNANAPRDLSLLFNPKSIAVIGASRDAKKIGHIVIKNILDAGFKGEIYPVNPNAHEILGLKCYPSASAIEQTLDLAIISVPADLVLSILQEAAIKNIKNFVIFSSGFKETGSAGAQKEQKIKELAQEYDLNILGPNCLGFVNTKANINATFAKVNLNQNTAAANLKFISQSGAIAASVFDWADQTGVCFSEFITLGNKTVLTENDILSYWSQPAVGGQSQPIVLYLESISNGKEFLDNISKITPNQPVVILKPGKSAEAQKAMQSHTGSIAGEDKVISAAFNQFGVIRCHGLEDLFDLTKALNWSFAPQGPNVAVVSNAGGPAVISADLVAEYGLTLASIDQETQEKLANHLPRAVSLLNPIDVLGDALVDRYETAMEILLPNPQVDSLVVILTPQIMTQIVSTAETVAKLSQKYKKPIFCAFIGGTAVEEGTKVLNDFHIPNYHFPENALKTLSYMWEWKKWVNKPISQVFEENFPSQETVNSSKNEKWQKISQVIDDKQVLDAVDANEILKLWGVNVPPSIEAKNLEEATDFGAQIGFPVVVKAISEQILHKTEAGLVTKGIQNKDELANAYKIMAEKMNKVGLKDAKIQIQKQVMSGVEAIVGVRKDPTFGNILMFGGGGILVELFKDINLRVLPVNIDELQSLVKESKIFPLLGGYRGARPYGLKNLYDFIQQIATLVENFPELAEFEVNPVIINHDAVWAVDARAVLSKPDKT